MSNSVTGIIDYGMGNLFSVSYACKSVGIKYSFIKKPQDFKNNLNGIILPGVGAFSEAMKYLKKNKMDKLIKEWANMNKPLLAICLGYQLLFEKSEEFEITEGLGILKGSVKSIKKSLIGPELSACVPIIGWQHTKIYNDHFHLKNNCFSTKNNEYFYYLHSYFVEPKDFFIVSSTASYGNLTYAASVTTDGIFGCQFHPEKSGKKGLDIYRNFKKNIGC
jgi:glutamine amidotransferase